MNFVKDRRIIYLNEYYSFFDNSVFYKFFDRLYKWNIFLWRKKDKEIEKYFVLYLIIF